MAPRAFPALRLRLGAATMFALVALPARAGAAQEATPAGSACAPSSVAQNLDATNRYWQEVWTAGGDAKVGGLLAPDEVHHWGIGGDTRGIAPFTARWKAFLAAFPDITFTVESSFGQGDLTVSRWSATGTQQGAWLAVPATGKVVTWTGINIFRFDCGKIAEVWGNADHVGLLQQLGALPASTTAEPMPASATPEAEAEASPATCADTAPGQNLATARRWTEDALTGRNLAVLDEIAAPDMVHHAGVFADQHGRDAVKRTLGALLAIAPDAVYTVDQTVAADDLVAVRWTMRGTVTGTFMGQEANAAPIDITGTNIYRFACGMIAEGWSEVDGLAMLQQLGGGPTLTKPELPVT